MPIREKVLAAKKRQTAAKRDTNKASAKTKQFTNFKRKADRQTKGWSYEKFGKRFGSK